MKDQFAEEALKNLDETEYNDNIADENAERNNILNDGRKLKESDEADGNSEIKRAINDESQREGHTNGRGSEVQPSEELNNQGRAGTDERRQIILDKNRAAVDDRQAELGSDARAEERRPIEEEPAEERKAPTIEFDEVEHASISRKL